MAAGGLVDHAAGGAGEQVFAEVNVVDTPAPIPVPGAGAVVPPAPVPGLWLKYPKHVCEPLAQQLLQG